ncbi:hypothetical protein [Flagellimonas myxillae]|nr:hypothetical protein [Muricauda myxillae]
MKKCFVLFLLLIVALICASLLGEGKDLPIQTNWEEVANNNR